MKKILTKIFSFIILLAIAFPLLHIFIIQIRQQKLQKEMEVRLGTEILHTITLDKKEVHWIKADKEIMVDGKMFDIKSISIKGNKITFSGLYDDDETELMARFKKDHQNNFPGTTQLTQLFQLLQSLYKNPTTDELSIPVFLRKELTGRFTFFPSSPFISIITPPPQV
ncbi:MAG: hypothetical protein HZB42_09070 [Sphingobacteriales bacterium]|nr:hypothetical protein [Sphingobacteriales bacterium]